MNEISLELSRELNEFYETNYNLNECSNKELLQVLANMIPLFKIADDWFFIGTKKNKIYQQNNQTYVGELSTPFLDFVMTTAFD